MTEAKFTDKSLKMLESYLGFKEGRARVREQLADDLRQRGDARAADGQTLIAKRIREGLE